MSGNITHVRLTRREDGVVIDTVKPRYFAWYGKYETSVKIKYSAWRKIDGYDSLEEALAGHEKYEGMEIEELRRMKRVDREDRK